MCRNYSVCDLVEHFDSTTNTFADSTMCKILLPINDYSLSQVQ